MSDEARFERAWALQATTGDRDGVGGAAYRRAFAAWVDQGRPDPAEFLRWEAGDLPRTSPAVTAGRDPDAGLDLNLEFDEAESRRGDRLELLDLDDIFDNDRPPLGPVVFTPAPVSEVPPADASTPTPPAPRSDWPYMLIAGAAVVGVPVATYFGGAIGSVAFVAALVLVAVVVATVRP